MTKLLDSSLGILDTNPPTVEVKLENWPGSEEVEFMSDQVHG
jgi:hypothetical protein